MDARSETEVVEKRSLPDWAILILINLASFGVVAALVGLSVIVDKAFFDLG